MALRKWNAEKDGPFSEKNLSRKLQSMGYVVSRYVYPPGTYFFDHTHAVDKIDAVVSGRFRLTTGQGEFVLEAGDYLAVPAGTVHSAEVLGPEPVVSLDAVRF